MESDMKECIRRTSHASITINPMQKQIITAAMAVLLSLPLALNAADKAKKGNPFKTADADGDGKVTQAEYVAAMKGKGDDAAVKARFGKLDKDSDGALTQQEFNAGAGKKGGKKKKDAN